MSVTLPSPILAPHGLGASHVRYRVLGLVSSLAVLTYIDRICIQRVKPDIQQDLGLSDQEFGFVFSAFMVGYAILEMPVGWLSDIWGSRSVILRIVLWWSLFTALTGAVYNFWPGTAFHIPTPGGWIAVGWGLASLVLVRFLFGCGEAGVYPTLANVIRMWFPLTERGFAQGVILMSNRIGSALSPVIVGILAGLVGWRWSFVILGLAGVGWAVIFAGVFRERPAEHPDVNAGELALIGTPPMARAHGGPPIPWRQAIRRPTIWAMGLLYFLSIGFGWAFFVTWQPDYLKHRFGLSFQDSQWWIGLPYLCGAAGCILGGQLSDFILRRTGSLRWARSLVAIAGLTVAGICFLAASIFANTWQSTVVLFAIGAFASDMLLAPYWAAITDVGGRFTGTLAGFFNMMALLGAAIFAVLVPWLVKHGLEWQQVLQMIAAAWLTAAALWLIVDAGKPLLPPDKPHLPEVDG